MLYSHEQLYINICMQKHNDAIKTSGHSSLENIPLILLKGLRVRGSWRPNKDCNILTSQVFRQSQPFFPVLMGWSTEGLGAQHLLGHGPHSSIFSPTDLNILSLGLYNNFTSTYFLRASEFANSTPRQSRSPLISSTGCISYLHRCISSFDSLAWSEVKKTMNIKKIIKTIEILFCFLFFSVHSVFWPVHVTLQANGGKIRIDKLGKNCRSWQCSTSRPVGI